MWQASACKAEQLRQSATRLRHRVRGAFTQKVMGLVCEILSVHQVLPAEVGAQLRFKGRSADHSNASTPSGVFREFPPLPMLAP